MSDVIKNIFNKDDDKKGLPIKPTASKFCDICQEAFSRDRKDDFKLNFCAECVKTDKISKVAFWKNEFALKKANTLPPHLAALRDKLAKNRTLVEGNKFARLNETTGTQRSLSEISASNAQNAPSFETIRGQVADLLPSVLAEMGLTEKVDAELLIDSIVPTKIATPIVNAASAKNALRQIVAETLTNLNMDGALHKESLIRPHGTATKSSHTNVLNEGYHRVSNDLGTRSRRIANPLEDPSQMMNTNNDGMNSTSAPMPIGANDGGDEFAPQMDDQEAPTAPGEVVHLPDDEANQLIQEKSQDGAAPPPPPEMPPDPMLNEGIGTFSGAGGEAQVPDSSEMENMPQDGGVKRVESSVADFVSRRIMEKKAAKINRSVAAELLTFAGKLQTNTPVQIVNLAEKDRNAIESFPPLSHATAAYSDGSQKTFKCYATDRGYFYINDDFSVHSKNENKFAEFISSDPSFVKWAYLPEPDPNQDVVAPDHDVEDMALPTDTLAEGEGDPGFNEIQETHLTPSPNNSMDQGGLMNDQQAIFDNGNPGQSNPEEQLVDTATNLLPKIEEMFPDQSSAQHNDMAISAALIMLQERVQKKATDIGTKLLSKKENPAFPGESMIQPAGYGKGYGIFEPADEKKPIAPQKTLQPLVEPKPSSVEPNLNTPTAPPQMSFNNPAMQKSLPKPPPQKGLSAQLLNKAASLMPYINDNYSLESEDFKLALAMDAARLLLKSAEDAATADSSTSSAPAATPSATPAALPSAAEKRPRGRPKGYRKPFIGKDPSVNTSPESTEEDRSVNMGPESLSEGKKPEGKKPEGYYQQKLRENLFGDNWSTDKYSASKVDELRSITADMTADELELSVEALMDMGYSDDDIMAVYADLQKAADCDDDDDVNGSTTAVEEVAKKFGPTSEESKDGFH